ncbi:MAG: aminotransferase class III-fold pyridoxal phosphate-dependent enzyme [Candidatus Abyssobacteria bacterium SURF_5]|uniref:Aminotransferase class III-fold pyridoxal phosphate-dependent enzyme n=1 Tax=Abyssobacteria bacterium (strain SURF_5) TaxID=2093360 RepID=A0A3A4N561_ABYX5|nr:MAG: aminotransferase class III-fold pyridoxal phosphate-dependent enzyme [Candidatus Abyssubacteria bacterium SURF_5]
MIDLKSIPMTKTDLDRYEVEHVFHSWSYQPAVSPKRIVSSKGVRFTDDAGRQFLDFSSCFVSHNIGHQDPRVVDALTEQAKTLCSFAPNFSTKPRAQLAKMVAEITPGDLSRTFFCLSGTEANEAAIKICHQYTGRRKIVARYGSYHGGTGTSMTLSAGDPRSWQQVPGGAERVSVPLPYCYRCMFGQKYPACDLQCVKYVDRVIEFEGGGEKVAGILFEPVTGANGIIVPPAEYFPMLRQICDRWGVLMIADEVMTGFGRTGKWFAMDHWNVVPDIMTMAKGITAAYMPLGAAVARKHIGDRFKEQFFSHGATYAGHALACATAIRVIQIYQEDGLIENAAKMGEYLLSKANELKEKHPSVGDVRGLGLFVGLELVKNKKTREPLIPVAAKIRPGSNPKVEVGKRLVELGMIAMAANPSNIVAMAPPLIVKKDEIDEGIAIMDKALEVADASAEK